LVLRGIRNQLAIAQNSSRSQGNVQVAGKMDGQVRVASSRDWDDFYITGGKSL
jgi:hypothetical protein